MEFRSEGKPLIPTFSGCCTIVGRRRTWSTVCDSFCQQAIRSPSVRDVREESPSPLWGEGRGEGESESCKESSSEMEFRSEGKPLIPTFSRCCTIVGRRDHILQSLRSFVRLSETRSVRHSCSWMRRAFSSPLYDSSLNPWRIQLRVRYV